MGKQKGAAIVVGLRARRTAAGIAAFNKFPESLCYWAKKKLGEEIDVGEEKDDVSISRKTHKSRRDAVRTPEFVEQLQNMIVEDPDKTIRPLAWELNVNEKCSKLCP